MGEKEFKVFQPNPFASGQPLSGLIIRKASAIPREGVIKQENVQNIGTDMIITDTVFPTSEKMPDLSLFRRSANRPFVMFIPPKRQEGELNPPPPLEFA
jgi:hypothetical protein